MLSDKNYDPKRIAEYTGDKEEDLWRYFEDVNVTLRQEEKARLAMLPKLQQDIKDFRDEFPIEFRQDMRRQHLENKIREYTRKFEQGCMQIAKDPESISERTLQHYEDKMHDYMLQLKITLGYTQGLSGEVIAKARSYPITNLVQHKNFMAVCPFHNEKTPSMYLKNNFYHCFGCGVNGDVIDFYMKDRSVSFKEAVEYLAA